MHSRPVALGWAKVIAWPNKLIEFIDPNSMPLAIQVEGARHLGRNRHGVVLFRGRVGDRRDKDGDVAGLVGRRGDDDGARAIL
jgi:hypothetical protein